MINGITKTAKRVEFLQEYGDEMKRQKTVVKNGEWEELKEKEFDEYRLSKDTLTVRDNKLFFDETLYVPDPATRKDVIREGHKSHQGITKTTLRLGSLFWWPG